MTLAALVLLAAALLRGAEYDEAYTVFLAQGTPRPDWPEAPFTPAGAWARLAGQSTPWGIAADLRRTDVHPPLYFWLVAAWRALVGETLLATRLFSAACALAALGLVGAIARRAGIQRILC